MRGSSAAFLALTLLAVSAAGACSRSLTNLLPEQPGGRGDTRLVRKGAGADARQLIAADQTVGALLNEFVPEKLACAVYDYSGIEIVLVIASFASADDSYGVYAGLTAMPRDRETAAQGELSYREPYYAGWKGRYAFWFTSPRHRSVYAAFYREEGERILRALDDGAARRQRTYHWNILPPENQYSDSLFFVRKRLVDGSLTLRNAYAANYLMGRNTAALYVQLEPDEVAALGEYQNLKYRVETGGRVVYPYDSFKQNTCYWQDENGYHLLHRYRWLILFLDRAPDLPYAQNFINIMYGRMLKVRDEALRYRKKSGEN